ncbi:MAG TPA: AI-2E family transporter [Trinickia sp.]|uniref:AI-2E family transporter n=1 Tax=Trinickia sp. TaxID=2571163 RepID=UPI002D02DC0C|nr:AI-2E family transporter [Trinickia sp.]HTI17374.1 AI-2E family transporter [Trinickia sp.]
MSQPSPLLTPYQRQALFWSMVALGLGILLWLLRDVLTPFLLGAIIAYILQPGVAWFVQRRVPRGLAALVMMLVFIIVVSLLALLLIVVVQREAPLLQQQVPELISRLHNWAHPKLAYLGLSDFDFSSVRDMLTSQAQSSAQEVVVAAWKSLQTSSNVVITLVGTLIMVPLVVFYLLYDWNAMLARVVSFVPRRWLPKTTKLASEMDYSLSQYLRGQLLVMCLLAGYYGISLTIAGFEIALPVGIFTGLAVFVPYIGFATGLILALLAALLQFGSFYGFIAVTIIYGAGQILESFILTPRLVGERIGLHPLTVIFALLAFGQLFGFFGVLLALPVSAILSTALREVRRSYLASGLYKN